MTQGKSFLTNRGDEGGSVRWYVGGTDSIFCLNSADYVDAEIVITDCDKCITLDFSIEKYSHYAKRIAKVDVLIDELVAFKNALLIAQDKAAPPKLYY